MHASCCSDWVIFASNVKRKLQSIATEGFKIAIFTNQKGISTGTSSLQDIAGEIDALQVELNVELVACVLTGNPPHYIQCAD